MEGSLRTFEDEEGDKRIVLSLEITSQALRESIAHSQMLLFNTLAEINQDFRESRRMVSAGKEPTIELFDVGTGPFAGADIRIKRIYSRREEAAK